MSTVIHYSNFEPLLLCQINQAPSQFNGIDPGVNQTLIPSLLNGNNHPVQEFLEFRYCSLHHTPKVCLRLNNICFPRYEEGR